MSHSPHYPCRIEMFGGMRIVWNNEVTAQLSAQKVGTLLARLACFMNRVHAREELMELLWPEVETLTGRNRLKQTLSVLRADLEPVGILSGSILLADRSVVRLNTELATTDVAGFEAAYRRAALATEVSERSALLGEALAAHRGPLLPGFYEDWILAERERLNQIYVAALLQVALVYEQYGDLNQATGYAGKALDADVLCEAAHCALMRFHAMQGRQTEALRQYREMERVLAVELGESPSAAARMLLNSIREGRIEPKEQVDMAVPAAPLTARYAPSPAASKLESVGGAVPLASTFYIVRQTDREFAEALARQDSIVLVKGPRQIGKTSLLARGLQQAREAGARVVLTDLQGLTAEQLTSAETLFRSFADSIIEQADLDVSLKDVWDPERGWNVNFERFLRREVLANSEAPVVWGLDEVDRLFPCPFSSEVFALFRSWHNLRSLHPAGHWARLTLAMAYATEAHLFITDLNQSPFNVGTRLTLEDFTLEQVADLNRQYGSPLKDIVELTRFFALIGGSPYLVRRGLHEMMTRHLDLAAFDAAARQEEGPFHDHLHRLSTLISQDAALTAAVHAILRGGECADVESFYRLRSAGVVTGDVSSARLRCQLYIHALQSRLQ